MSSRHSISTVSSGSVTNASNRSITSASSSPPTNFSNLENNQLTNPTLTNPTPTNPTYAVEAKQKRSIKKQAKVYNIKSNESLKKTAQKPEEPAKEPEQIVQKPEETAQEAVQPAVKIAQEAVQPAVKIAQEAVQPAVKIAQEPVQTAEKPEQIVQEQPSSIDEPPLDSEISVENFPEKLDIFGDLYSTQERDGVINTGPQTLYQFLKNYGLDATYGDEYKRILEAYARVFGNKSKVKPEDLTCQTQDFFYIERGLRVRLGTLGAYIYSVGADSPPGMHYRGVSNKIKRFLKSKANLQKCPDAPPAMAAPSTAPSITAEMSAEVLQIMKDVHKYLMEIKTNSEKIYEFLTNEKYSSQTIEKNLSGKSVKDLIKMLLVFKTIQSTAKPVVEPSTRSFAQTTQFFNTITMQQQIGKLIEENKKNKELIKKLQAKAPVSTAPLQARTQLQIALDKAEKISKQLHESKLNDFSKEQPQKQLVDVNKTIAELEATIQSASAPKPGFGSRVKGFFTRRPSLPPSFITPTKEIPSFTTKPSTESFLEPLTKPIPESTPKLIQQSLIPFNPKGSIQSKQVKTNQLQIPTEQLEIGKITTKILNELSVIQPEINKSSGINKKILDTKINILRYLSDLYMQNDKINTQDSFQTIQQTLNKIYESYNDIKKIDDTPNDILDKLSKLYRELQYTYKLKQNKNSKKLLNTTKKINKSTIKKTINSLKTFLRTIRQRFNPTYTTLGTERADTPVPQQNSSIQSNMKSKTNLPVKPSENEQIREILDNITRQNPFKNSQKKDEIEEIINEITLTLDNPYASNTEQQEMRTKAIEMINLFENDPSVDKKKIEQLKDIFKITDYQLNKLNEIIEQQKHRTGTPPNISIPLSSGETPGETPEETLEETLEENQTRRSNSNISNNNEQQEESESELVKLVLENTNSTSEEKIKILKRNYPQTKLNNINKLFTNISEEEKLKLIKKIIKEQKTTQLNNDSSSRRNSILSTIPENINIQLEGQQYKKPVNTSQIRVNTGVLTSQSSKRLPKATPPPISIQPGQNSNENTILHPQQTRLNGLKSLLNSKTLTNTERKKYKNEYNKIKASIKNINKSNKKSRTQTNSTSLLPPILQSSISQKGQGRKTLKKRKH